MVGRKEFPSLVGADAALDRRWKICDANLVLNRSVVGVRVLEEKELVCMAHMVSLCPA